MSSIRVLLADNDKEYGNALAKAISNLHHEFEIVLTNLEKYGADDDKNHVSFDDFDLILIGGYPDIIAENLKTRIRNKNKVVILIDYKTENIMEQSYHKKNDFWQIYKYVNISDMAADLNYLIGFITGEKRYLRNNSVTHTIGFYSISGGVGKTVVSIGASRELSRYHDKKVLYISFEEIPATELFFNSNSKNRNMGDYLYYLLEKQNENICTHINGFAVSDEFGVDTFYPSSGRNDLTLLTKEELACFIKTISDSGGYDYLVFDLNCDLSEETLFLMNHCNHIILIQSENPVSQYKNKKLTAYLKKMNSMNLADDMICVVNQMNYFDCGMNEEEERNSIHPKKIYIEKDESILRFTGNYFEMNINHSFGLGIKKIVDEVLSDSERQGKYER